MSDDTRTESAHSRQRLRRRVERALVDGQRGREVIEGLRSLAESSPESNPDRLFAHRQLAELQLEDSPWRAALHLRQLLQADAADDGVHALMGLCQALLGNFSAAVASYRRAIREAPRNPWYHHNLGHLLDVGLGQPAQAQQHLRVAHEIEREEDEITASLAHCLARLGEIEEATELARRALHASPQSEEHRALLSWIEDGAPERTARQPSARQNGAKSSNRSKRRNRGRELSAGPSDHEMEVLESELLKEEGTGEVALLLASQMPDAGFSGEHVRSAITLWTDFCIGRELRVVKPATFAAAIEYAIAKVDRVPGVTQAGVAERYGVAPGSISSRYGEIRAALELIPDDPRYRSASR